MKRMREDGVELDDRFRALAVLRANEVLSEDMKRQPIYNINIIDFIGSHRLFRSKGVLSLIHRALDILDAYGFVDRPEDGEIYLVLDESLRV